MKANDPISSAFEPVYGKPCWQAKAGHAGFLYFEFGTPHLRVSKPKETTWVLSPKERKRTMVRQAYLVGDWHLWIYCCNWSITLGGERIAYSEASDFRIGRGVGLVDGQALTRVTVDPQTAETLFEFDLGCSLSTWPFDPTLEQWLLYEPSGNVLSIRGDGCYSYQPGNTHPDDELWHPIPEHSGNGLLR